MFTNKELNTIGKRIKYAREKKKISLRKLSEMTGKTFQLLHQYENGERSPKAENIEIIAKALDASPTWLKQGGYSVYEDGNALVINACIDKKILEDYKKDSTICTEFEDDQFGNYVEIINIYRAEINALQERFIRNGNTEMLKATLEIMKLLMHYTDDSYDEKEPFEI